MNNTRLLESIDNMTDVIYESDFSVMDALFAACDKMTMIMENYNGNDVYDFAIFQEADEVEKNPTPAAEGDKKDTPQAVQQGNPEQSTSADAKKEGILKKILFAPFKFIQKILNWIHEKVSKTVQPAIEEAAGVVSDKTSEILKKVGNNDENWLKENWGKLALGGGALLTAVGGFLAWKKVNGLKEKCEAFINGVKAFFVAFKNKVPSADDVIKITDNKILTKLKINEFVTMIANLKNRVISAAGTSKLLTEQSLDNPDEFVEKMKKVSEDMQGVAEDTTWWVDNNGMELTVDGVKKVMECFNSVIKKDDNVKIDEDKINEFIKKCGDKINTTAIAGYSRIIVAGGAAFGAISKFAADVPTKLKEFWDHMTKINKAAEGDNGTAEGEGNTDETAAPTEQPADNANADNANAEGAEEKPVEGADNANETAAPTEEPAATGSTEAQPVEGEGSSSGTDLESNKLMTWNEVPGEIKKTILGPNGELPIEGTCTYNGNEYKFKSYWADGEDGKKQFTGIKFAKPDEAFTESFVDGSVETSRSSWYN